VSPVSSATNRLGDMVVAYYREQLLPASETFVVEPTRHLDRYEPIFFGMERVDGLHLPSPTFVLDRGSPAGRLRRRAFRRFGLAPGLVRSLRRHGADLVHAHFGPDGMQVLPVARRAGLPLVTTWHGYDASWSDEALAASNATRAHYVEHREELIREGALHLPVSGFLRDRLLEKGYPEDRVRVHHIGVDTRALQLADPDQREDVILFAGRFVEKKAPEQFVRAAAVCVERHPQVSVVLIGDGPLRAATESLAREILPGAAFHGWQSADVVHRMMARARVLCVPSVRAANGDTEGTPTAICEAGALGTPTIGYRHSGIPEAVEDGASGLLVGEGEVAALGDRLATVFDQPELWHRLSEGARAHITRHFDVRVQSARLETLYDEVIQDEARPRDGARGTSAATGAVGRDAGRAR
jgi:glycosyltransferase involved in cell wall biosynthesis